MAPRKYIILRVADAYTWHTPTSPTLRRKGAGKGKEMAVEGDGDVEMLDGDENLKKFNFA